MCDHCGDVIWVTVVAQSGCRALSVDTFGFRRVHVCVDWSRLDDVHANSLWAELTGEAAREADDGSFGHRVEGDARSGHAFAEAAADRDDAATFLHVFGRCLDRDDGRADIDLP